jgi:hypothetical protein
MFFRAMVSLLILPAGVFSFSETTFTAWYHSANCTGALSAERREQLESCYWDGPTSWRSTCTSDGSVILRTYFHDPEPVAPTQRCFGEMINMTRIMTGVCGRLAGPFGPASTEFRCMPNDSEVLLEDTVRALAARVAQLEEAATPPPPVPPPPRKWQYNVMTDFGAVGDGVHDDTAAVQAGIDAAVQTGGRVYIPPGIYRTTVPLKVNLLSYSVQHAVHIESDWAIIRASAPMESVVNITIASHLTIRRLLLDGNNTAQYGLRAFKVAGSQAMISQVTAVGSISHGFFLEACQVSHWQHLIAQQNGGDGLFCRGCNGASFSHLTARENLGNGIRFEGATVPGPSGKPEEHSGGAYLSQFSSEQNMLDGVNIGNGNIPPGIMTGMSVRDGWLENNHGDGCNITAPNVLLSGLRITDYMHTGRAVRLGPLAIGAVVHGTRIAPNGVPTARYDTILVQLNRSYNSTRYFSIAGNYNIEGAHTEIDVEFNGGV